MSYTTNLRNFNTLAEHYQHARQGFADEVLDFISDQVGDLHNKKMLDVGCGTGIATRQLRVRGAEVHGVDLSEEMIRMAQQDTRDIKYAVAPADQLPFENSTFNLVTAFSAFHWFADRQSIDEIRRVMKKDGIFAVVNKNDISGIRTDVEVLFKEYKTAHGAKHGYDPQEILIEVGFQNVQRFSIVSTESYSLESAVTYLQSIALWNLVPDEAKEDTLSKVKDLCVDILDQTGKLNRELETVAVLGSNN